MADRITKKWTKDLKGAFGDTQQIRNAIKGEQMWEQFARRTYSEVINHSSDKSKQTAGVDFTIKKSTWKFPITVDVKANMKWGYFYVENNPTGWLRNPNKQTIRIVHIEVRNGYICEYDRKEMIDYLDRKEYKEDLVKLSSYRTDLKGFIRKYPIIESKKSKTAPKFNPYYNPHNITVSHRKDEKAWDTDKYPMEEYDDVTDTFYYPYGEVRGFSDSD